MKNQLARPFVFVALSALACLVMLAPTTISAQQPLYLADFSQAAVQGFGDAQNSMARASAWWNGKLYVATSRSFACIQSAISQLYIPLKPYPPPDPTLSCTNDPHDLPLQAEIWRWTPDGGAGVWDRVYQSPNTIPIPGTAKFTAREIGFRDMVVFQEADGTEALYVSGQNARGFIAGGLPPPTILRSTDGQNFAPIPQEPGTVLGELTGLIEGITISSFNRMTAFNGRLYVVFGGDFGHGTIWESANPEGGNNNFTRVSPPGMTFTYLYPFNGFLYAARGAQPGIGNPPYQILKTDATGAVPYTFSLVYDGARPPFWNASSAPSSVATMHAVGDEQLWVATNQPTELVRINPNDTWDLFVGQARQTSPSMQWKYPRSGLGDGFDWAYNIHIHRIQDHNGLLYTASNDMSNVFPLPTAPGMTELFGARFGFDVHRSTNGWHFYPVTFGGFEELNPGGHVNWFNFTGRVAQSTPEGLFLGTGNNQYGLQMWRAQGGAAVVAPAQKLEAEKSGANVVLSWDPSPTAALYRIFRADYMFGGQLGVPFYANGIHPTAYTEIGTTTATSYTDVPAGLWNHYYVVAEDGALARSEPSNVARLPSLAQATTFNTLSATLTTWQSAGELTAPLQSQIAGQLLWIRILVILGKYADAQNMTLQLQNMPALAPPALAAWRVDDLQMLLGKLSRRISLASLGKISVWTL